MKNLILAACASLMLASLAEAKSKTSLAESSQNAIAQSQDCAKKTDRSWNGRSPAQASSEADKWLKMAKANPGKKIGRGRAITEGR